LASESGLDWEKVGGNVLLLGSSRHDLPPPWKKIINIDCVFFSHTYRVVDFAPPSPTIYPFIFTYFSILGVKKRVSRSQKSIRLGKSPRKKTGE
jgi:hypothetical protein